MLAKSEWMLPRFCGYYCISGPCFTAWSWAGYACSYGTVQENQIGQAGVQALLKALSSYAQVLDRLSLRDEVVLEPQS